MGVEVAPQPQVQATYVGEELSNNPNPEMYVTSQPQVEEVYTQAQPTNVQTQPAQVQQAPVPPLSLIHI